MQTPVIFETALAKNLEGICPCQISRPLLPLKKYNKHQNININFKNYQDCCALLHSRVSTNNVLAGAV